VVSGPEPPGQVFVSCVLKTPVLGIAGLTVPTQRTTMEPPGGRLLARHSDQLPRVEQAAPTAFPLTTVPLVIATAGWPLIHRPDRLSEMLKFVAVSLPVLRTVTS
jgi:hypothetical protein